MKELDDAIYDQIRELCAGGDALADGEFYEEALACYWKAWALLPPPAHDWDAATWILGAIGDAEFLRGDYAAARDALQDAVVYCPDGLGNPFLHMRLGEAQYELGNRERAADELIRAYAMGDPDLWADEDPKYLDYLATVCAGIENYSRLH